MKLHTNTTAQNTFNLLLDLMQHQDLQDFYLVGGTALSLLIGHRKSDDLDLFTQREFKSTLVAKIHKPYQTINVSDNSIELVKNDTKVMFLYFAYPLYEKILEIEKIKLADPVDIGLMKLLSLQGRTTKKDIIDLYFIDKNFIKLPKLLGLFEQHYPKDSFNAYQSLKQLINKKDLDEYPMPELFEDISWDKMYNYVSQAISDHISKILLKN